MPAVAGGDEHRVQVTPLGDDLAHVAVGDAGGIAILLVDGRLGGRFVEIDQQIAAKDDVIAPRAGGG